MSAVVEWTPLSGGPVDSDICQSSEWWALEEFMPADLRLLAGKPGDDPGQAWLVLGPEHETFLRQLHARPEWGGLSDTLFAHLIAAIESVGPIKVRGW